jgi:hypothetical protein
VCVKTCGPDRVGWKTEVCTAGVTVEGSCQFDCSDPTIDWTCYADLGSAPECAVGTQASMPCFVAACSPCQGVYLDSSGAQKVGGCVCGASSAPKWSCANATAWPICQ